MSTSPSGSSVDPPLETIDIQTIIEYVLNEGLMTEQLVHDRMDEGLDFWKSELSWLLEDAKK